MLQPAVAELLPKLVYHMDEPAIDMAIPSYLVSQAARETLRVMLSGMGGDEVFRRLSAPAGDEDCRRV